LVPIRRPSSRLSSTVTYNRANPGFGPGADLPPLRQTPAST
jgi:hypothetical protein